MNTVTLHLWLKIIDFTLIKSFWPQDQNTLGKNRGLYKMRSATYFPAIFLCFFWYRKQEIANRISPMIWNIQFFPSTFIKKGIKTKIIDQNHQLHCHFCQKNKKKVKIVIIVPFMSSEGSQSEEGRTSFWMLRARSSAWATRLYLRLLVMWPRVRY